jgi:lipase maturation factor 1
MSPWFQSFLTHLLRGEPAVVGLLRKNPFPDAPPKFIRVSLYQYRFTDTAEWRQSGNWWHCDRVWEGPGWSLAQ